MTKVLIIGCGYVGKAVANFLNSKNIPVSVTTRNEKNAKDLSQYAKEVHLIKSPEDITSLIPLYDTIIFSVAAENRSCYKEAYFDNAVAIVKALKNESNTKQLIYTSTTSVYGDYNGEWVNEDDALLGETEQAKILINTEEELMQATSFGHNVCILRLGQIIGPGREVEKRLERMSNHLLPGDGTNCINLSPLGDIVAGIYLASKKHLSGTFNLCSDLHIPRKQYYDEICEKFRIPKVKWDPSQTSIHGGNKKVSCQKIKNAGLSLN
ncbi:MAG: NAD-dependent epimerase/dehydratase family protein [Chlamydiota bacterium]|nr:NAD-dependent epimerase/dehydratase family protein [Chlamydiota bacterium]